MVAKLNRRRPPFPYDHLPAAPSFSLKSADIKENMPISKTFASRGENISPELHWQGAPANTLSFAVSCFDPDAPSPAGFWHWMIVDLDANVTNLPRGCGESDLGLDQAAFHIRNDAGTHAWTGPDPVPGDGAHRYVFAVHALDVDTLGVDDESTPSLVACQIAQHTLGRALLTATYSIAGVTGADAFLED